MNPDTRRILGKARVHGRPEDQGLSYIEYRPGGTTNDSGFFALLGCPNGSGIVRMLTDNCNALGNKTIEIVRVLTPSDTTELPIVYFVLAEVAATTPTKRLKRSAAGQRRDAKRQEKRDSGGSECSRLLGSAYTAGHYGNFVHAVSDQSSMSAVALIAKQVEVSVMD